MFELRTGFLGLFADFAVPSPRPSYYKFVITTEDRTGRLLQLNAGQAKTVLGQLLVL